MLFLQMNAKRVLEEGVGGHFAELGVHKGHSARLLAEVIRRRSEGRRLFLFDTFGGFEQRDLAGIDASVAPIFADTSLEAVRALVGNEDLCEYRPGYLPDTAGDISDETLFSFVHLDCDLYEPMRAALGFFYPRMSSGGYIVIHDYTSQHWPSTTRAVDEFSRISRIGSP